MLSNLSAVFLLTLAAVGQAKSKSKCGTSRTSTINTTLEATSTGNAASGTALPVSLTAVASDSSTIAVVTASSNATKVCKRKSTASVNGTSTATGFFNTTSSFVSDITVTSTVSTTTLITITDCSPGTVSCAPEQQTYTTVLTTTIPVYTTVYTRTVVKPTASSDAGLPSSTTATNVDATSNSPDGGAPTSGNNNIQDPTTVVTRTSLSTTQETIYATASSAGPVNVVSGTGGSPGSDGGSSPTDGSGAAPTTTGSGDSGTCPPQNTVTVTMPAVTVTVTKTHKGRGSGKCTRTSTTYVTGAGSGAGSPTDSSTLDATVTTPPGAATSTGTGPSDGSNSTDAPPPPPASATITASASVSGGSQTKTCKAKKKKHSSTLKTVKHVKPTHGPLTAR